MILPWGTPYTGASIPFVTIVRIFPSEIYSTFSLPSIASLLLSPFSVLPSAIPRGRPWSQNTPDFLLDSFAITHTDYHNSFPKKRLPHHRSDTSVALRNRLTLPIATVSSSPTGRRCGRIRQHQGKSWKGGSGELSLARSLAAKGRQAVETPLLAQNSPDAFSAAKMAR